MEAINSIVKWRYSASDDGLYMKPYKDSFLEDPNRLKGPDGCDGYGVYFEDRLFGLFELGLTQGALRWTVDEAALAYSHAANPA